MRRSIPPVWRSAAVRLQRCPQIVLTVRGMSTSAIGRSRGALTGNGLAPWFGRLIVEDALLAAMPSTEALNFHFLDAVLLRPMAWSDNIVAFGNSPANVAKSLRRIADVLGSRHLHIKDDSCEIVPSCSRRLQWSAIRSGHLRFSVVAETKLLGFWISCNGDNSTCKSVMLGGLRGKLACMDKRFTAVPAAQKAKWWQIHSRGYLAYFAPFLGCNRELLQSLAPINNQGARKILGLRSNFNVHATLHNAQTEFNICVHRFFCKSVISYVGHVFRHMNQPVSKLLSLPLSERLDHLRLLGPSGQVSDYSIATRTFLQNLGLNLSDLIHGKPNIRGHSGRPFRWGDGWFFEIKDGGLGWSFQKTDTYAVNKRTDILLELFWLRFRRQPLQQLQDLVLSLEV